MPLSQYTVAQSKDLPIPHLQNTAFDPFWCKLGAIIEKKLSITGSVRWPRDSLPLFISTDEGASYNIVTIYVKEGALRAIFLILVLNIAKIRLLWPSVWAVYEEARSVQCGAKVLSFIIVISGGIWFVILIKLIMPFEINH